MLTHRKRTTGIFFDRMTCSSTDTFCEHHYDISQVSHVTFEQKQNFEPLKMTFLGGKCDIVVKHKVNIFKTSQNIPAYFKWKGHYGKINDIHKPSYWKLCQCTRGYSQLYQGNKANTNYLSSIFKDNHDE